MRSPLPRLRKYIPVPSARKLGAQLTTLVSSAMLVMVLAVSIGTSWFIDRSLKNEFIQSGEDIATLLAEQVDLAVLLGTPEGAREDSAVILSLPSVLQLAVYESIKTPKDQDAGDGRDAHGGAGTLLVHSGGDQPWYIPDNSPDIAFGDALLERDGEQAWQFKSPVFSDDEGSDLGDIEINRHVRKQIGYVRVLIAKQQFYNGRRNIIVGNIGVLLAVATVLMLVLQSFSRRLTKPLEKFAAVMAEGAAGEQLNLRVDLQGSEEARTMGESFNRMMQELDDRENLLSATRDQALAAARMKSEFAANVSHEIRTPLNGILGTLNLLADTPLTAEQSDLLKIAGSSSEALMVLINDILDFSRLSLDQSSLAVVEFDLRELLEDLVFLHAQSADAALLDVVLIYDPALSSTVESDPNKIRQLMNNLMSNAVKFTDQGSIELRVSLETVAEQTAWLRLSVCDTGIGIAGDDLQSIFQPYSQSDGSMSRKYRGTGLGLSICERLAELMHGDIGVDSELGAGSKFYVQLPVPVSAVEQEPVIQYPWSEQRALVYTSAAVLRSAMESMRRVCNLPLTCFDSVEAVRAQLATMVPHTDMPLLVLCFSSGDSSYTIEQVVLSLTDRFPVRCVVASSTDIMLDTAQRQVPVRTPLRTGQLIAGLYRAYGLEPEQSSLRLSSVSLNGVSVLLVEDIEANQIVAKTLLEKSGATVTVASNGEEALEMCRQQRFALILMDCQLPLLNGYDATRQLRQSDCVNARVPVIAMTANVDVGDKTHCYEAGMNDFLAKPFRLQELVRIVQKWVQKPACSDG